MYFNDYYFIYVYGCFACMYISPLCVCLILIEVRRVHWIPLGLEL